MLEIRHLSGLAQAATDSGPSEAIRQNGGRMTNVSQKMVAVETAVVVFVEPAKETLKWDTVLRSN